MRRQSVKRMVFVATARAPFRAEPYHDLVDAMIELMRDLAHVVGLVAWIVARIAALLTWPISAALLYLVVCRLRAQLLQRRRLAREAAREAARARAGLQRAGKDRPHIPQPQPFRRR